MARFWVDIDRRQRSAAKMIAQASRTSSGYGLRWVAKLVASVEIATSPAQERATQALSLLHRTRA